MKKVSIVIPVYNGRDFLQEALNSIYAQTYLNIEIVVSSNVSSDEPIEDICNDPRVKLVYGGPSSAENWQNALDHAAGDYIKLLCHDDTITPDCIAKQVEILENNPAISLVTCKRTFIDADGVIISKQVDPLEDIVFESMDAFSQLVEYGNYIGETACVLSRNIGFKFPQGLNWLGDQYWWAFMLKQGDLYYQADYLAYIRKHPKQDTHRCVKDPLYNEKEAHDKEMVKRVFEDTV